MSGSADPIRVAIVEDHRVFADALDVLLRTEIGMSVAGSAQTAEQAMRLLEQHEVEVLLIDLDVDSSDALTVARRILVRWPRMKLVILAPTLDDPRLAPAFLLGARGWLAKSSNSSELATAIRLAARDETYLAPRLLTRLLRILRAPAAAEPDRGADIGLARLTVRERDVLQALADGKSRTQIAAELGVSTNTVRTHVQHVLQKLDVPSAVAAVALARRSAQGNGGVSVER